MSRRLEFAARASKDLRGLDRPIAARVAAALARFALDGFGDVKPLQGMTPTEWRLRVGDWRVRFRYEGDAVTGACGGEGAAFNG